MPLVDIVLQLCPRCKNKILHEPTTHPSVCIFCDEQLDEANSKSISLEMSTHIIPFQGIIDPQAISNNVCDWLIENVNTPDDILDNASFGALYGVYIPLWIFYGKYKVNWNASSGYYREETYTEYKTRYEKGKSKRYKETKTRTVTDWKPANGNISGSFIKGGVDDNILENSMLNFCEGVKIDSELMKSFDIMHVSGFRLIPFVHDAESVYKVRVKSKIDADILRSIKDMIPGDRNKDINWNEEVSKKDTMVYYPYMIAQYQYDDKGYLAIIDGANYSRIGGDFPMHSDKERKFKYVKVPYWLSILVYITSILAVTFWKKEIDPGPLATLSMIFVPLIIATYFYAKLKRRSIEKLSKLYRQTSLDRAYNLKLFSFGL